MAIKKTPAGTYKAIFSHYVTDEDGKRTRLRPSKTFSRKADAKNWLLEQKIKSSQGQVKADTTFDWYFKEYLKSKKHIDDPSNVNAIRPTTEKNWNAALKAFTRYFGESMTIQKITKQKYQQFINSYAKTHKHSTVELVHTKLKAVLDEATLDGYLSRNPARFADVGGQASEEDRHFSIAEIKKIAKYIRETTFKHRDTKVEEVGTPYAILMEIYTGARVSELAGLTWEDLDYDENTVNIDKQVIRNNDYAESPTKTPESVRTIPVPHSLLEEMKPLRAKGDHYVFYTLRNKPISSAAVNKILRTICAKIKIPVESAHIHELRHAHVALLLDAGVDVISISRRLGHANVKVTMDTYAYLIDEQKDRNDKKIIAALNGLSKADNDDEKDKD